MPSSTRRIAGLPSSAGQALARAEDNEELRTWEQLTSGDGVAPANETSP
jgi:hypothetical protein